MHAFVLIELYPYLRAVIITCICSVSIKTGYTARWSKWENKQYRLVSQLAAFILPRQNVTLYREMESRLKRCCISVRAHPALFITSAISGCRLHRDSRLRPSSFLSKLHLYKSLKTHRP